MGWIFTSTCIFCTSQKIVSAEKRQWMLHLRKHREAIIKLIVERYAKCPVGAYPKTFTDRIEFASHLRWAHTKTELYDWAFDNLIASQEITAP